MTTAAPSTATGPGRAHWPRVALFRTEARLLLREPAILIWASIVPLTANVAMAILPRPVTNERAPAGPYVCAIPTGPVRFTWTVRQLAASMASSPSTSSPICRSVGEWASMRT